MTTQVLIAGAGPTGLTLAVDLARRGVAVRVVDRDEAFAGSRGKGLQPRTQEVLDDLGVIERTLAVGGPYPPVRGYRHEQVVWERPMAPELDPREDVPYPNTLMVPQWRTVQILRERLAELGGHVEFRTELTRFAQDDNGVTVILSRDGSTEDVRVDYLVGADGGRSGVRKGLPVEFAGQTLEQHQMFIADVRVDGLDRNHWHMWLDETCRLPLLALCPMAGTDTFQLTVPTTGDTRPGDLQELLERASGRTDLTLREVGWSSSWRANVRMVDRYRVGRVFLAGDAAHVHSPTGGQGLNTGVQDAHNLGWKLGAVLAGADQSLLDTYQAERLPVAAAVLGISTELLNKAARGDEDAMRRDDPVLKQLGLHYRDSPLSVDLRERPGALRAGDRAPDGVHGEGRLFDLFRGPQFTVLAFGDAQYEGAASVTGNPAYDIAGDALVVVRPDGYIGLIASTGNQVAEYLARVRCGVVAVGA
ncbi:FAD-dependent monooxygenase [Kutzneria viridogrisea]|uniref:2-polyprenyl-6-methoxyphenol hydroxylase-like FAD-dependent oxidoreductase n=1 Tax=Kutzneria viridogrisea TaxID=47990 RepID=A0ABR6BJW8_9PSEU|nr:2-polyprenyl-6-methoxyphenol hydroxylase-like FAD-dependent oxidoreductase [Kutzneria viridogrisea]